MGTMKQGRLVFRILAGALALLMSGCGVSLLLGIFFSASEPWYRWSAMALGQVVLAWVFGAYALGLPGPYNWRPTSKSQ